ncbi:hypothetical protein [Roseivivax isoporae]|uniref:Uncharacterized protein n=1 Tax=Roseivivax isoporae LMG 25204 TaxID=1449351 RepID=X7F7Q7_9RHOB|nr:hypothetical protein [Roseivivax isoporae]ETX28845.1 hypothetical protein RISW2_04875 [Roseivivax isoporae LMG 25204]
MSIEVVVQPAGGDEVPSRLSGSRLMLNAATTLTLPETTPPISETLKVGADLRMSFEDGRQLYVENFFSIDEQGNFSTLQTADGRTAVSGLSAPEPAASDLSGAADLSGDAVPTAAAAASDGDAGGLVAEDAGGGGDAQGWSSTATLAGLGLVSGFGSTSLLTSDGGGGDGGETGAPTPAPDAATAVAAGAAPDLGDDVDALLTLIEDGAGDAQFAADIAALTGGAPHAQDEAGVTFRSSADAALAHSDAPPTVFDIDPATVTEGEG